MLALHLAQERYRQQAALARQIAAGTAAIWRTAAVADLSTWWVGAGVRILALLAGAQLLGARQADGYLDAVLDAQGIDPTAEGAVSARAFTGIASDGRALESLLFEPVIRTKTAIGQGAEIGQAMRIGGALLEEIVRTQIADAARVAVGVGIAARPAVGGYVRMLTPPSCGRCAVLAGKFFRWRTGFQRHPHCDCIHIPSRENLAGDLRTNPYEALKAGQIKGLSKADARALEDGADISQVINARRGMTTASVFGRDVKATTEGATRRGVAGQRLGARGVRLMPEQIYADSARFGLTRAETITVLRQHGYIL